MIIVLEGVDACGKTTVGTALSKSLNCKLIHFPADDTVTGPMIRNYLARKWKISSEAPQEDQSALAFQALNITNRMELMHDISPCSESDTHHVVLVRYWQSAWVYGQMDGLSASWLESVHSSMPKPDLNILLNLDPHIAISRKHRRGGPGDRYEVLEAMKRAMYLYRTLWDKKGAPWHVVDASESEDKVLAKCMDMISC